MDAAKNVRDREEHYELMEQLMTRIIETITKAGMACGIVLLDSERCVSSIGLPPTHKDDIKPCLRMLRNAAAEMAQKTHETLENLPEVIAEAKANIGEDGVARVHRRYDDKGRRA